MNHDASHANGGGQVAIAIQERAVSENIENGPQGKGWQEDHAYTLEARNKVQAIAFEPRFVRTTGGQPTEGFSACLRADANSGDGAPCIATRSVVRRLTPRECERLQGFPDDYTLIPYRGKPADKCPDGPRYKAIGNSMAVLVMAWIGRRIEMVDKL
jgi:DNA (cytosine-5)-methyltransferase 1